MSDWEKLSAKVETFADLEKGWDDGDAGPVPPDMIASVKLLLDKLKKEGFTAPDDIYPLPVFGVMMTWYLPGDVMRYIEVEAPGKGDLMVTYPGARKSKFHDLSWGSIDVDDKLLETVRAVEERVD